MTNRHDETTEQTPITRMLSAWTRAEADGDAAALERLLADDFVAFGPFGFSLSKPDWLERHATGALAYDTFALEELALREYPEVVVATARQTGEGAYHGHAVPAALRVTLVATERDDAWQLAVLHMSFIAGTPGSPTLPGRPG